MTGGGGGFCILQVEGSGPSSSIGFAGLQGKPVHETTNERMEAAMPAGDGTGPMGMGPMTGRAAGVCAGYGMPGSMNPIQGHGVGMGGGRGRGGRGGGRGPAAGLRAGCRNMFYATGMTGWQRAAADRAITGGVPPIAAGPTREQQLDALKGQAEYFEGALGELQKRIEELEAEKAEK